MANKIYQTQETSITWKSTGGTNTITLTSLGDLTGRKGTVNAFAASHAGRVIIELLTKFATGPTAGNVVEVYWCSSRDNTNFDAGYTSADAAASDTDLLKQLHWIGNLAADNTTAAQQASWIFQLPGRYGFPIIFNRSGQALSATAGDHVITVTPYPDEIQ